MMFVASATIETARPIQPSLTRRACSWFAVHRALKYTAKLMRR